MPNKSPSGERRTLTVTLLLMLLISALTATLLIGNATANPIGYFLPQGPPPTPIVKVGELNTDKLTLTFSAVKNGPWITPYGDERELYASYDPNHDWGVYSISAFHVWVDGKLWSSFFGSHPNSVSLEGLSNGWHTLEVIATASGRYSNYEYVSKGSSGVIEFQVDTPPPIIRVITSQETFEASSPTADVPLNFTVNKPASWIGYSLDDNNVVTATDKVASTERFGTVIYQLVLRGVPVGAHTLTVYAEDTAGNRGESEPFTFAVTQEAPPETEQTSTPFSTAFATVGISTAVVAVSLGSLFYFKKRKR